MTVAEALAALRDAADREFACDPDAVLAKIAEAIAQEQAKLAHLYDVSGRLYAVRETLEAGWTVADNAKEQLANAETRAQEVISEMTALCDRLKTTQEKP